MTELERELLAELENVASDIENDIRWANGSDLEHLIARRDRVAAAITKASPTGETSCAKN